jgi:hypothetical protein
MNILPLIFTFLILLTLGSYAFVQQRMASTVETRSYLGSMRAERLIRNRRQSKLYYQIPKEKQETAQEKERKKKFNYAPRDKFPPQESARINLAFLFVETPPPLLYETTAKFLEILYGHTSFFKGKNPAYPLLDAWIEKAKKNKASLTWIDLFPDDPSLKELFYKMLKGTSHYDLRQTGYPPLEDFFCIREDKKGAAIYYPHASLVLLKALFDEKILASILQSEEDKREKNPEKHCLDKAELEALLSTDAKLSGQLSQIMELFCWNKGRQTAEYLKETDKVTNIRVRKKVVK